MAIPAIKRQKLTPDQRSANVSRGVKNYWDTPEGQARREEQRKRMMGNEVRKKSVFVGAIHGDKPDPGNPPPADGAYTGTEPGHGAPGAAAAAPGSPEAAPLKAVDEEKFKKVWPQFLVRLHKCFQRGAFVLQWGGNKIVQRFFPNKRVIVRIDDYTKADAEAESEFSDLLLDDSVPMWIARNRFKAWIIWRLTWIVGGTHVDVEEIQPKVLKETHNEPGSKPKPSTDANTTKGQGITSPDFD